MQEGYIETAGCKVWYAKYGEEQKKTPVLVVHGGPAVIVMKQGSKP